MSEGDGDDRPTETDEEGNLPPAERPDEEPTDEESAESDENQDDNAEESAETEDVDGSDTKADVEAETGNATEDDETADGEAGGADSTDTDASEADDGGDDTDETETDDADDTVDDTEADERDAEDTADNEPADDDDPDDTAVADDTEDGDADDEGDATDADEETDADGAGDEDETEGFITASDAAEGTSGEDTDEDDSDEIPEQDVTISGGAATPTPEDAEPVAPAGAPDDQEMPLTDHIEEMVKRLGIVIVIMALVSALIFPLGDRLINFLWYSFLPGPATDCVQQASAAAGNFTNGTVAPLNASATDAACPRLYHPIALVLARLKVASLGGFIIALPVFVYQTYLFMRPGLYPNERRYYLASVPTSLILAGIGVAFAYLLVLPIIFQYFLGYSQPVADVAFGLSETFGLILLLLGMFAVIFQIPLFIMLAIMMGVTTRRWLEGRRLYFWFGFAGIAFLFSPDPTGMAPFIVAATMVVLFEGSLLLLRWTGR